MSSDKYQVEMILATNMLLAKQLTEEGCDNHAVDKGNYKYCEHHHKTFQENHATDNNNNNCNTGKG